MTLSKHIGNVCKSTNQETIGNQTKIAIETELAGYYDNLAHKELNLKNSETANSNHERRMSK